MVRADKIAATGKQQETFVLPSNMDSARPQMHANTGNRWAILEQGVERVMTRLTEGIDMPTYMKLYTAVHDFCTQQKLPNPPAVPISAQTHQRGGKYPIFTAPLGSSVMRCSRANISSAHLLGEELYNHLISYLRTHLRAVHSGAKTHSDDALLSYYIREWNRYTTAATFVNHLFRYLNRHWVKREMDEGKMTIYDVYTLHLVRWKEDMFLATQQNVMRGLLRLVERQRNGETIEHQQIKSIVESFGKSRSLAHLEHFTNQNSFARHR